MPAPEPFLEQGCTEALVVTNLPVDTEAPLEKQESPFCAVQPSASLHPGKLEQHRCKMWGWTCLCIVCVAPGTQQSVPHQTWASLCSLPGTHNLRATDAQIPVWSITNKGPLECFSLQCLFWFQNPMTSTPLSPSQHLRGPSSLFSLFLSQEWEWSSALWSRTFFHITCRNYFLILAQAVEFHTQEQKSSMDTINWASMCCKSSVLDISEKGTWCMCRGTQLSIILGWSLKYTTLPELLLYLHGKFGDNLDEKWVIKRILKVLKRTVTEKTKLIQTTAQHCSETRNYDDYVWGVVI